MYKTYYQLYYDNFFSQQNSRLMYLFPKLKIVWDNSYLDEKDFEWHEQLRICNLEKFPSYFRLKLSPSELSDTQIKSILALAGAKNQFRDYLLELTQQKLLNGTTKARVFIEQIKNSIEHEISVDCIPAIVEALLDVKDKLLSSEDNQSHGLFNVGDEVIINRFISKLLRRVDKKHKLDGFDMTGKA